MEKKQTMQRTAGLFTFFLSGICAISSGVIVSILQESYGLAYSMTGTLLSFMNIGNLLAGFAAGILPSKLGMKKNSNTIDLWVWMRLLVNGFIGMGWNSYARLFSSWSCQRKHHQYMYHFSRK